MKNLHVQILDVDGEVRMDKKGLGTWGYIIAGVIAILVMFVMMGIFTDSTGKTTPAFKDCVNKGGECLSSEDCEKKEGIKLGQLSCNEDQVCCFTEE